MGIFLKSILLCDVKCKLSSSSPSQTSVKYKTISYALWIGFATVSLSFLKINVKGKKKKKLKTKTEAARETCHMEVILTKDRQRESEMNGGMH